MTALEQSAAPRLAQHRTIQTISFGFLGFMMATFVSRLPSIREHLGLTLGELSQVLLVGSLGALVSLAIAAWATEKFGTKAILIVTGLTHATGFIGVGLAYEAKSVIGLGAAYFLVSMSSVVANVPFNVEASQIERLTGRPFLNVLHGGYSVGMVSGLLLGALASGLGISPLWHLGSISLLALAMRVAVTPRALLTSPDESTRAARLGGPFVYGFQGLKSRRTVLLGLIVVSAAAIDFIPLHWFALSLVGTFHVSEASADLVFWLLPLGTGLTRFFAGRPVERLGRTATLRISAGLVVVASILFGLTSLLALAVVAAILWGVGAAMNYPIAFRAAADDPAQATVGSATAVGFSAAAGLVIPPLMGHLADHVGLQSSFFVATVAAIGIIALAGAVRPPKGRPIKSHDHALPATSSDK